MTSGNPIAQIALVFVSYFLVIATLPPISAGWTGLALLIPVLYLLRSCGSLVSLFFGACWGALVGSYMYWGVAAYSMPVFGLTLLVLSTVGAVLFWVTGLAVRSPRTWMTLLVPLPWVLSELVLNAAGIPYSLSVLLAELTWLLPPLKLGGQHFLAACVYLLQTIVFLAVSPNGPPRRQLVAVGIMPVLVFVIAPWIANGEATGTVRVAAIQTNSHPYFYIYMAADGMLESSIEQRERLQSEVAADTELVVWPEWAVLGYQFRLPSEFVQGSHGAQLINAQDLSAQGIRRNLVAALDRDGRHLGVNGKAYLIPFIEQSFSPATQWNVHHQLPGKPLSTICYESVFPRPVSAMVADGAGLITILTSDAFAGPSLIPFLHSRYAILRSVESNRYAVRSANGGVSMVVSNRGEVLHTLPMFEQGVIHATVQVFENITPYTRFARAWWWGLLLAGLASSVLIAGCSWHFKGHVTTAENRRRTMFVMLVLTLGVATTATWGQRVYVSTLLNASSSVAQPQSPFSLFFKDAFNVNTFGYADSRANAAGESVSGALAYVLRGYGVPTTSARIREEVDRLSLSEANLAQMQPLVQRYGFALQRQRLDTDLLTMPVIAVMNSGEAVVVDNITREHVTLFSPVNGLIELDTAYFFERLATQDVVFVAPPVRSWDE